MQSRLEEGLARVAHRLKSFGTCVRCEERPAVKTNGRSEPVCERCARGVVDPVRSRRPRVGRNDRCPCGSGRKWKRCHGATSPGGPVGTRVLTDANVFVNGQQIQASGVTVEVQP